MRIGRLWATAFLFLGAFCPLGTHALAHEVTEDHAHAHDDEAAQPHEHGAGDHQEPEQCCDDDAPRLADSGAKLLAAPLLPHPLLSIEAPAAESTPRLAGAAALDPPLLASQCLSSPSAAGRAPPA